MTKSLVYFFLSIYFAFPLLPTIPLFDLCSHKCDSSLCSSHHTAVQKDRLLLAVVMQQMKYVKVFWKKHFKWFQKAHDTATCIHVLEKAIQQSPQNHLNLIHSVLAAMLLLLVIGNLSVWKASVEAFILRCNVP